MRKITCLMRLSRTTSIRRPLWDGFLGSKEDFRLKKFLTMLLAAAMLFALAACGTTPNEADNNYNNTQDDHQAETPDTPY